MNPRATTKPAAGQIRDGLARGAKHDAHERLEIGISDFSTASTGAVHLAFHAFQASPEVEGWTAAAAAAAAAVAWRRASSISRASVLKK